PAAHRLPPAALVPAPSVAPRPARAEDLVDGDLHPPAVDLPAQDVRRALLGSAPRGAQGVRARALSPRPRHLPDRMTHLSFKPRGEKVAISADYVVVGSGAGGASAAVTLARAGATVAVIEAGPWRDPSDYPHS